MGKAKTKPLEEKVGNVVVKIYRRQRVKGETTYWAFDVADYSEGKRKFITFADGQEARDKASDIAKKLANRQGLVLNMTNKDQASYARSLELIEPTGLPLELAAALVAEAHQKLGGRSLMEAVNYFVKRHPTALPRRTVQEVYEELLEVKEKDGSSPVYLKDLTFRLGRFCESFKVQLAGIGESQINEWLRELKGGARNRNNFRGAVRVLFRFAESAGYVPKDQIDFEKVAKANGVVGEVEIFTAEEIVKLLNAARVNPAELKPGYNLRYVTGPGLVPLLVLGGFAGLRTAEIERQLWSDVMLDRGFIRVTGAKGNTAQKRLVPIGKNLAKWLAPYWREEGLCCEYGRTSDAIARLAERAGVKWKHNGLRHSYGSYRLALVQDPAKVAYEMGNSPRMIVRHYRELVLPVEAETWFGIEPDGGKAEGTSRDPRRGLIMEETRSTVARFVDDPNRFNNRHLSQNTLEEFLKRHKQGPPEGADNGRNSIHSREICR